MRLVGTAAVAALLLTLALCQGQPTTPSESSCRAKFAGFSQNDLLNRLAPCQYGATSDCCEAGQNLAGFRSSAPLPGCLCYKNALDELIATAESNPLARTAGVNRNLITSILQQCSAPFFGGTGGSLCPDQSAPPPPPAPSSQPASETPVPGPEGTTDSPAPSATDAPAPSNPEEPPAPAAPAAPAAPSEPVAPAAVTPTVTASGSSHGSGWLAKGSVLEALVKHHPLLQMHG